MIRFLKWHFFQLRLVFRLKKWYHVQEDEIYYQYYKDSDTPKTKKKQIVFLVDGRTIHGGLADRFKGIVSTYAYCKQHKIDFRLEYNYPFQLSDYFLPNKVDWKISEEEICYNPKFAHPIMVNSHQLDVRYHNLYLWLESHKTQQLHVYGNSDAAYGQFSELFNELFKPSSLLQQHIEDNLRAIGNKYISATFRFQQLLGDLKEGNYPTLNDEDKQKLIDKCHLQLELLHNEYPNKTVLVTADSNTFLDSVRNIPYIYVIPGTVVHMDYTPDASYMAYEKSFLDFLLIANADKVHLVYSNQMYKSGFPGLASKVYNKPYQEIFFK